ncbi:MAG TPA: hypothetical protein VMG38_10560 [Trebonia sp.]|nr:hypothetical protein [Trebonia sp.]
MTAWWQAASRSPSGSAGTSRGSVAQAATATGQRGRNRHSPGLEAPGAAGAEAAASTSRLPASGTSYRRAPARHEDAGHVLGELLGYDAGRVDDLNAGGAFGPVTVTAEGDAGRERSGTEES